MKLKIFSSVALGLLFATQAVAGTIVYNSNKADPAPRDAIHEIIKDFEKAHPDIKVKINEFDHEGYKTAIRNFLSADAPDVIDWFPGNRMKPFVDADLLEPLDDVWEQNGLNDSMSATIGATEINGKKYALPMTYYNWGVYYRKDIFEKYGIVPPKTWDEFLAVGEKLKANGVTPITIGTKYLWTAGGVFDYINLRTNGYDFHMALTSGQVSWEDDRVKKTFANWRTLLDKGFFIENHTVYSWQEALSAFIKGDAAMYVMGHFMVAQAKHGGLNEDQIGFFQFPIIDPNVPVAEEAPIDSYHIPARAKNKKDAKVFLAYLANREVQTKFNKAVGQLPPNKYAEVDSTNDPMLPAHAKMLGETTGGIAQFFDRDAPAAVAKFSMQGFQEFMVNPDKVDSILARLEKFRKKHYKIK